MQAQCCASNGQHTAFGTKCTGVSGVTTGYCGGGKCSSHHTDCLNAKMTMTIATKQGKAKYVTTDEICDDWIPGSDS